MYITVPSGSTIISDGNTVAWYDYDASTTLSLTVDSSVYQWNDKLGSGHNLVQATSTKQPLWTEDGILFNGTSNCMKTEAFTYLQPNFIDNVGGTF